jgi:UDP-N-acetylmuramoyl-L-alanyl-D-glutamate--2,6-diaminopimelate ligase
VSAAKVQDLLGRLRAAGVSPTGITADSRKIKPGEVFAAWPGLATDGRRFIRSALERGAAAVLWDVADGFRPESLPVPAIGVSNLRDLGGHLAHEIYRKPSSRLWMAGITGTNGKTTVCQWLARALTDLGMPCGIVGTLGAGLPGRMVDSGHTTPDALDLHRMLGEFLDQRASAAAMEVSSIGLDQGRVNGVEFDVGVFTNLTRDHLDYHGDMDAYAAAKAKLFELPGITTAVLNLDDAFGVQQAERCAAKGMPLIGYSLSSTTSARGARMLVADDLKPTASGFRFSLMWAGLRTDLQVRMVAPFNVSNLLAVLGALLARGVTLDDALGVISRLSPPEGRMQLLGGIGEPLVIIDYAHSPDALAKVLDAVRTTATTRGGRLICVFGCGGNRDPGKRPVMFDVARQRADRVIVTSDNPRNEDPMKIIEQIAGGAGPQAECIVDRLQAIRIAIAEASADDVVLLAGKGHEPYQEVLGVRLPFSDLGQAKAALRVWAETQEGGAC